MTRNPLSQDARSCKAVCLVRLRDAEDALAKLGLAVLKNRGDYEAVTDALESVRLAIQDLDSVGAPDPPD